MAKAKNERARVLVGTVAFGLGLQANDVVEGSEAQITALVNAGAADTAPAAVKYAIKENGNKVVTLPETSAEDTVAAAAAAEQAAAAEKAAAITAAEGVVAEARAAVEKAATDEAKAEAAKALEEAEAALKALTE